MEPASPSRTARSAAGHRAAHQALEGGSIFADPLACAILGDDARAIVDEAAADPSRRPLRLFIAARSRLAEDALAAAVSRGVRQAVVLGAGLDTLSLRNPHAAEGLRFFEADHPATQAWKRRRLAEAGLALPELLSFAPIDFERQSLAEALLAAGFRRERPAFFHWLGVVPYLTQAAIMATLDFIASCTGAEVIFDYSEPFDAYPPKRRARIEATARRAAAIGEPWLSHFEPDALAQALRSKGFAEIEDHDFAVIAARFFGGTPAAGSGGGHVIRARRLD